MKKNFAIALTDFDGATLMDGQKTVTAAVIAVNALLFDYRDEQIDGEQKATRARLAYAIHEKPEQDLTPEQIALIKQLIGKAYAPIVVMRMYDFLNE